MYFFTSWFPISLRLLALILCSNCSNTFNKVFTPIGGAMLNYFLKLGGSLKLAWNPPRMVEAFHTPLRLVHPHLPPPNHHQKCTTTSLNPTEWKGVHSMYSSDWVELISQKSVTEELPVWTSPPPSITPNLCREQPQVLLCFIGDQSLLAEGENWGIAKGSLSR